MNRNPNLLRFLAVAACVCAGASVNVRANSYASSLTNNAGDVSFRLNDAADSVKVTGNNGALTIDLGPLPRGLTVTNLSGRGLNAGAFSVTAFKTESGAPTLIGGSVPFNAPRGVTVNQNPSSPYFGWVYVANVTAGTKGDGLFAHSADLADILNQGATAKTAGLNFSTGTTASPYRPKVGRDDNNVYIADWSDGAGNLYVMTPELEAPAGGAFALTPLTGTAVAPVGLLNNHGSVAAVEVLGSIATGNMRIFTVDEDLQEDRESSGLNQMNSLWRYEVNSGPLPWGEVPTLKLLTPQINFTSQTMDLSYSPATGFFYVSQLRSAGNEPGVYVVDGDGNRLFDSKQGSQALGNATDFLNNLQGVTVSTDGRYLATVNNNNVVTIVPLVDGIPDLARRYQYTGFATTASARGIAFDLANNLYVVTSGLGILQSLSIGVTSTNITSSTGTFTQQTAPLPETTIALTVGETNLVEGGAAIGTFTITRSGGGTDTPFGVNFTLSGATRGTASAGDYFIRTNGVAITNANSITIPAGATEVVIELVPNDDNVSESAETVTFTLASGPYQTVPPIAGTATVTDNDPAMIEISGVTFNRMYEGNPFDRLRYTLQRLGDPALGPIEINLTYSGTATSGADYTPVNSVVMEANTLTQTFDVLVAVDTAIEPVETVTVAVATGAGYLVGTNNVLTAGATGVIVDDDLPAETVLFAESFNTADVANNWTIRDASASGTPDFTATFGFNYADLNVPPAPHSAENDTFGLLMSANKIDAVAEAAGVNAYANGKDFTGNYAVRFDMYLMQNASAGTTEHALFGINHDGSHTNWFSNATAIPEGWTFDGVWAAVIADASNLGDYLLNTAPRANGVGPTTVASRVASSLTQVFHQPPWTAGSGAGSPGNTPSTTTPSWAQVELSQSNGVVTLTINATNIFSYTNTTTSTHGTIMLGYADTFNSIGSGGGGLAIYDNLRVVSLASTQPTEVRISATTIVGGNLQIDFTAAATDTAANFKLASTTAVTGPYVDDNTATVTQVSPGTFRVSAPIQAANRFFQIHRVP